VINKIYRTSAINGIIGFIEILSPINFSLRFLPRRIRAGQKLRPPSKLLDPSAKAALVHCAQGDGVMEDGRQEEEMAGDGREEEEKEAGARVAMAAWDRDDEKKVS
jgi:hypothetical protein